MAPEHKAYPASDYKKPYEHVSELVCFKNQQQWPVRKSRFQNIRKIQKKSKIFFEDLKSGSEQPLGKN